MRIHFALNRCMRNHMNLGGPNTEALGSVFESTPKAMSHGTFAIKARTAFSNFFLRKTWKRTATARGRGWPSLFCPTACPHANKAAKSCLTPQRLC